ncbi:MAG: PAS domain S-box protein [Nitrosomonas sp.]|jgi:PAS domain S-box-containing protein|nr:PAS domain S-box protein [Nitrosomonas sp.]
MKIKFPFSSSYYKLITYVPAILVGLVLLVLGIFVDYLNAGEKEAAQRQLVHDQLSTLRAQLEGHINSNIHLVQGLVAVITEEPELTQERFGEVARHLFGTHSKLRNLSAAPDLVIRYTYPIEGNEAAIGLDFRKHSNQYHAVKQVVELGKSVLAGPVNLVQGGHGFIMRVPVYTTRAHNGNRFWGVVSAVIDIEKLYRSSGLLEDGLGIAIAIRGDNATGAHGQIFFGQKEIFASNPVLLDVTLPYGTWQMAAVPNSGWSQDPGSVFLFRAGLLAIGVLILTPLIILGRVQKKKSENDARLRGLFALSPIGITLNDFETGVFIEVNDALLAPTGYTVEEFLKLSYRDITPAEYAEMEAMQLMHLEQFGRYGPYEKEYIRKNGERYPVLLRGMMIRDAAGKKLIWSIVEDLSRRKQSERALQESQGKYQRLVEDIGDQFVIYSLRVLTNEVLYVSNGFQTIFGFPRDEMLGKDWTTAINWLPESLELARGYVAALAERELESVQFEVFFIHPDGGQRALLVSAHPAMDESGNIMTIDGIVENVTERKKIENNLIIARIEADRANKAKSEFLSNMSHELRTPMNAILGFSQLMQLDQQLSGRNREYINEIMQAGNHLLELINDILDLARIESGRIEMKLEPVSIGPVIEESLSLMAGIAQKNSIRILRHGSVGLAVVADRIRLKQIMLNLLSNGIKYNREGGAVWIKATPVDEKWVWITVTDTGYGIAADKLPELFQPFNRLEANESGIEGTGIGLALTKRLVEQMDGSVSVTSKVGAGSTFGIKLPLSSVALNRKRSNGESGDGLNDVARDDPDQFAESSGPSEFRKPVKATVLCIEDNPANLRLISQILRLRPVNFISTHSPALGIELAQMHQPDLILLDINIPHMDGFQVLKLIKKDPVLKHIPVIAVTAKVMAHDIERGIAAGFAAYVTKPLDVDRFLQSIDCHLNN